MERSRKILLGIIFGLVAGGVLAVGFFVWVFFTVYEESELQPVEATVQNVFEQDISNDWGAIEKTIGPEANYELLSFQLEYTPSGEVRSLGWTVQERQEDGSCEFHSIYRMDNEYRIYRMDDADTVTPGAGVCNLNPYMPFDLFLHGMTSDWIRGTTPQEPYDSVRLEAQSTQTKSDPFVDQNVFTWDGSRLQGPIQSGEGYLIEQRTFVGGYFEDKKMFLIDGVDQ